MTVTVNFQADSSFDISITYNLVALMLFEAGYTEVTATTFSGSGFVGPNAVTVNGTGTDLSGPTATF